MINESKELVEGQERAFVERNITLGHSNIAANSLNCWCPLSGQWVESNVGWCFHHPWHTHLAIDQSEAEKHGFYVPAEHAAHVIKALRQCHE